MNREQLAGKWQQVKRFAQQQWGRMRQRSLGRIPAVDAVAQRAREQQLAEWRERQHKVDPIHK